MSSAAERRWWPAEDRRPSTDAVEIFGGGRKSKLQPPLIRKHTDTRARRWGCGCVDGFPYADPKRLRRTEHTCPGPPLGGRMDEEEEETDE